MAARQTPVSMEQLVAQTTIPSHVRAHLVTMAAYVSTPAHKGSMEKTVHRNVVALYMAAVTWLRGAVLVIEVTMALTAKRVACLVSMDTTVSRGVNVAMALCVTLFTEGVTVAWGG